MKLAKQDFVTRYLDHIPPGNPSSLFRVYRQAGNESPGACGMTITEWVAERLANCERLSRTVSESDQDGWLEDAAYFMAIQTQLEQRAEMLAALKAYEALDAFHANCDECEERPEYCPEACEKCFPFADDGMLTIDGATRPLIEWAEMLGLRAALLRKRLDAGWPPLRAIREWSHAKHHGMRLLHETDAM